MKARAFLAGLAAGVLAFAYCAGALLVPVLLVVGPSSCATLDRRIETATVAGPLRRVLARTAVYVEADPTVEPSERSALKARAQALSGLLERARLEPGELEAAGFLELAAEHDARVAADPALSELERRVYLGDSESVRKVAAAARSPG